MITKKQKEILDFLNTYSKNKGYAPSLDEIRAHFKLASVSTAHYYVDKLEKEGYLEKISNQPRSINIYSDKVIKTIIPKKIESFSVPILGSANAGPATIFAEGKINGKNLEEGYFVLIDSEYKNPKNDDYVLSVIDGCANLKKFERDAKTGTIRLLSESKNPKHKPIYV